MNLSPTPIHHGSNLCSIDDWIQPTYLDVQPFEDVNSIDGSNIGINPGILDNWNEWDNFGHSKTPLAEFSTELSGKSSGASSLDDDFQFYSITPPLVFESVENTGIDEEYSIETSTQSPTTSKHSSVDMGMVTLMPSKRRRSNHRYQSFQSSSEDYMESKDRPNKRIPHNEVERKYRDGLNAHMERLRHAVPSLIKSNPQKLDGPPKPSKVMVLASAVDYIKWVEHERDRLLLENQLLRGR